MGSGLTERRIRDQNRDSVTQVQTSFVKAYNMMKAATMCEAFGSGFTLGEVGVVINRRPKGKLFSSFRHKFARIPIMLIRSFPFFLTDERPTTETDPFNKLTSLSSSVTNFIFASFDPPRCFIGVAPIKSGFWRRWKARKNANSAMLGEMRQFFSLSLFISGRRDRLKGRTLF